MRSTLRAGLIVLLLAGLVTPAAAGGAGHSPTRAPKPSAAPKPPRASTVPELTPASFRNPPASVRPAVRWWWDQLLTPSTFSLPDALSEVDALKAAGFGRFEIAWAAASYGTPEQRAALAAVAQRARRVGLQLDMTLGASWPYNAPTAQGELGQTELMYGRIDATGPSTFDADVAPAIGDDAPRGALVAVTAARVLTAGPTVTAPDSPPAQSTVLDPGSLVDLTGRVHGRHLTWKVPSGQWIVFSFWRRTQSTCGAFTSIPGSCVSLIDAKSTKAALAWTGQHQIGSAAGALKGVGHAVFEDSLEYTADELYWSRDFPSEFRARRGYDAAKFLPLFFVETVSDVGAPAKEPTPDFELPHQAGARYRHDYYRTLTDLYVDGHVKPIQDWARARGLRFRGQLAYSMPLDVIRSTREAVRAGVLVDDESLVGDAGAGNETNPLLPPPTTPYPYTQPDSPAWRATMDHYRQVTSGAAQGGGLEVSSELGATFGRELRMWLREYKRMMDKQWAAGITRPILHGMTHSPASTPWPGASHFGGIVGESLNHQTWPEWSSFRRLNDYWGRGALVLEQGAARTDVAVLRDSFLGKVSFDGLGLERRGFTIGYVDPVGLATAPQGHDGSLYPAGPDYRAVVVDLSQVFVRSGGLPGATLRALDLASSRGLRVVFVGGLPTRGLSGRSPAAEDGQVRDAVRSILGRPTTAHVAHQGDVATALAALQLQPRAAWSGPVRLYTQARETASARYYYVWNATGAPVSVNGSFEADGAPVSLGLWSGSMTPLGEYGSGGGHVTVPLRIEPHGTAVLMFPKSRTPAHVATSDADEVVATSSDTVELRDHAGGLKLVVFSDGTRRLVSMPPVSTTTPTLGAPLGAEPWTLQVSTYGPEGVVHRPAVPLAQLSDWRTIPGLTTESGIGTYETHFAVGTANIGAGKGLSLDLGSFEGSVRVSVNGRVVTPDIDPQRPLDVTPFVHSGDNVLTITLATTPFNKALASPTTIVTRPLWPNSVTWGPQAYGILGPVQLIPYSRAAVRLATSHG